MVAQYISARATALGPVLGQLDGVRRIGMGWLALCPAHADRNPSLSVKEAADGRLLVHCFAGCRLEAVLDAVGLSVRDLFPAREPAERRPLGRAAEPERSVAADVPASRAATLQPEPESALEGCTLQRYAEHKRLPPSFLVGLGLSDVRLLGWPAVRIPYYSADGTEGAMRYRHVVENGEGNPRFTWRRGSKPMLYGL